MSKTNLHIPELKDKFVDYRDPIWGDSYNWSWNRSSEEIKYLVIHHSVTNHEATPDDIALIHKNKGWGGIGYHFVITKDGMVYYVGDIGTARANVADMNEKVIGICMVGDFTRHLPSDEQIASTHLLCKFFLFSAPSIPNVKDWNDVVGHKELSSTACPGSSWDKTQDGDMWWRVKTGTPYAPQPEEEVSEEVTTNGQAQEIKAYREFMEELAGIMKLSIGEIDFAKIRGKAEKLMQIAKNAQEDKDEHKRFLEDVAKGLGCKEVSEKAVREALVTLEARILEIKKKKIKDFGFIELLKLYFKRG